MPFPEEGFGDIGTARVERYERALKAIGALILRYEGDGDEFPDPENPAEDILDRIDTIVLDTLAATPKASQERSE